MPGLVPRFGETQEDSTMSDAPFPSDEVKQEEQRVSDIQTAGELSSSVKKQCI